MTDFDVALRVRWRYEAGGAKAAAGDLDKVAAQAKRLGAIDAGAQLGKGLKAAGAEAQGATRDLGALSSAATRLGQSAYNVQYRLDGASKAADRLGRSRGIAALEGNVRDAVRQIEVLERRLDQIARRADRLGHRRQRQEFGNEFLQAAGLGGAVRLGMSSAAIGGVAAGSGIAAAAGAIALSTREAIKFETAMSDVNKAVNDLSPEGLKEMERTILRISRTTGIAKGEIAQGVAQLGFAGLPTKDLARAAEFSAKAAVAFNMPAAQTNDALAHLGTTYKLPWEDVEKLADKINMLGDTTAAKESQIIDFLDRVGSSGRAIGMNAQHIAAFGAGIMAAGAQADVAATGFKALAMKLGSPELVHDKDFAKGLRAIHMNVRQLKADMAVDPDGTILKVLERVSKLPTGKKLTVAGQLGGMEYADDFATAADQYKEIAAGIARLSDKTAQASSIENTFAIANKVTQKSIERATASISAFATHMGQRFTPTVGAAAEAVAKLFGSIDDALERGEKVEFLSKKLAGGEKLSPKEQADVDKDPQLKAGVDRATGFLRWAQPKSGAQQGWWGRFLGEPAPPQAAPAAPLPGKRADLADGARIQYSAYTEEIDRQLDRTERVVQRHAGRIRDDLALTTRAAMFGGAGDGNPRIINASLGGVGGADGGGGWHTAPGRFGGMLPGRHPGGGGGGRGILGVAAGLGPNVSPSGRGARGRNMDALLKGAREQLAQEGVPPEHVRAAAAALMGNVIQESGGDPNKVHDGGTGYGIYGARDPGGRGKQRRTEMLRWLAKHGYARNSAEGQARYMAHEAMSDPSYRRTASALRQATEANLGAVTDVVAKNFEAPNPRAANYGGRINNAYSVYKHSGGEIAGNVGVPSGWMRRAGAFDAAEPMSARFIDPSRMQRRALPAADPASGGASASAAGPTHITQNFHGGFDAATVARRAQLEQNRSIRRAQAGALHGVGRIA